MLKAADDYAARKSADRAATQVMGPSSRPSATVVTCP
jgi:hypothetical protein